MPSSLPICFSHSSSVISGFHKWSGHPVFKKKKHLLGAEIHSMLLWHSKTAYSCQHYFYVIDAFLTCMRILLLLLLVRNIHTQSHIHTHPQIHSTHIHTHTQTHILTHTHSDSPLLNKSSLNSAQHCSANLDFKIPSVSGGPPLLVPSPLWCNCLADCKLSVCMSFFIQTESSEGVRAGRSMIGALQVSRESKFAKPIPQVGSENGYLLKHYLHYWHNSPWSPFISTHHVICPIWGKCSPTNIF